MKPKTNKEKVDYILHHRSINSLNGLEVFLIRLVYNTDVKLNDTGWTTLDFLYLTVLGEQGLQSGLPTEQDLEPALESPPDEENTITPLKSAGAGINAKTGMVYTDMKALGYDIYSGVHCKDVPEEFIQSLNNKDFMTFDMIREGTYPTTPEKEVNSLETKACYDCDKTFLKDQLSQNGLCPGCVKKNASKSTPEVSSSDTKYCTECGKPFPSDQLYRQAGMEVCAKCLKVMDP